MVVSFQSIELASFWPYGAYAFGIGLLMRLTGFFLARRDSLYAIDDYVSMGYPNIFLVIVLAEMLNIDVVIQLATWFLVPMFALAPLDDFLRRRQQRDTKDPLLLSFLRVDMQPVRLQEDEETSHGKALWQEVAGLRARGAAGTDTRALRIEQSDCGRQTPLKDLAVLT